LQQKIERYQEHGVEPFPGGQFLEYAKVQGLGEGYLPACVEAGYRWIEVSDNLAAVELSWKEQMIRSAVAEHGLRVLGEVGKKEGLDKGASLVEDARACMGAGAELVLVEAAELISGDEALEREVEAVVEAIGLEHVMFELPGPWIAGVAEHQVHQMRRELIGRYGAEVNLGNVAPDELVASEGLRRGLGVNAGAAAD
jgi:phosphosulfolactate synthase